MNQRPRSACKYHPEQRRHWHCNACDLSLCTRCKPFAEHLRIDVTCPLCRQRMSEPGAGHGAVHADLRHPAGIHFSVLLATVAAALLTAVVSWPMPGLILAIPAGLFLLTQMSLAARAAGEAWTDRRLLRSLFEYEQCEFALRTMGFALPFIAAWLLALGLESTVLMILVMAAGAMLMPAALISLLITGGDWDGLNPRRVAGVIRRLGRSYGTLVAATAGPMAIVWLAAIHLQTLLPPPALHAMLVVSGALYALAWSHRVGLCAYRNRRTLEYAAGIPGVDRPKQSSPEQYEPALMLADADALIRERRFRQARDELAQALTRYPDNAAINDRFEALLRDTGDDKIRKRYIERRMQRLFRFGRSSDAARLWRRNSPGLDGWLPSVPALRYQLALELEAMGDHPVAFRLLVSLPLKARGIGQPGAAWRRAARILEEDLGDPGRAAQLRQVIAEKTAAGEHARSLSEKRCTDAARADRQRRLSGKDRPHRPRRSAS